MPVCAKHKSNPPVCMMACKKCPRCSKSFMSSISHAMCGSCSTRLQQCYYCGASTAEPCVQVEN